MNKKLMLFLLLSPLTTHAVSENGTGEPKIQLVVDEQQRLVLQVDEGDVVLQGSSISESGYAELILDATTKSTTNIEPAAARAEVSLGCGEADIILYQPVNSLWVEHSAFTVAIESCWQ